MTQKLFCLCVALLFAFVTLNVATAEETQAGPAGCPCVKVMPGFACPTPCKFNCYPPTYRVGLFGVVRPVVYAPVYRPVYYPPRYLRAPYCYPTPVCW